MRLVTVELLVPSADLPPPRLRRVLDAMVDAGFPYEREPGDGGELWHHADLDWRDGATLDEAVERYAVGEDECLARSRAPSKNAATARRGRPSHI